MRTDGGNNTFEWWYFDAELDDGSKLVITFLTKPFSDVDQGLVPEVSVELTRSDGSSLSKDYVARPDEFSASREQCDVQIGGNFFRGDLKNYTIHANVDGLVVDVRLTGEVPSWRPKTGFWFTASGRSTMPRGFPRCREGRVEVTLTIDGAGARR